ncbi:MAG: hypothetical protein ACE5GE_13295 [Phycisphaerae bacterium]
MILLQTVQKVPGLTAAGWVMMLGCISLVLGLCGYCLWRIIRDPTSTDHLHTPLDIETGDLDD